MLSNKDNQQKDENKQRNKQKKRTTKILNLGANRGEGKK